MTTLSDRTQAPFVAQDGLTYASIADRLLGRPEKTTRNGNIRAYRLHRYTEEAVRAYWQAFDAVCFPCPPPSSTFGDCHRAGIEAAKATGGFASPEWRAWTTRQPSTRSGPG